MKHPALPLLVVLLSCLAGCAGGSRTLQPEIATGADQSIPEMCSTVFPRGRWQFIHSIVYSVQGRTGGPPLLGVTRLDGGQLGCALMTIEGLTLFSATVGPGGEPKVRRAVDPFDKPSFAGRLIRDVRMIFLPPETGEVEYGRLADSTPVCRYTGEDGFQTDILPTVDGCWQINSYTPEAVLERTVTGHSCRSRDGVRIPDTLELQAFGPKSYTLTMTLANDKNLNRNTSQ